MKRGRRGRRGRRGTGRRRRGRRERETTDKVEYRRLFQNVYMYIPWKVYWRHIRSLKRLSEDKASEEYYLLYVFS